MLAVLAALLLDSPAAIVRDFVEPYEVSSLSRGWRAAIDRSSRLGDGPCSLRVERDGELAWEESLAFKSLECGRTGWRMGAPGPRAGIPTAIA